MKCEKKKKKFSFLMENFSISSQLLFLVFVILLAASMIFVVTSYLSIRLIAEDQVYTRLESFPEMNDKNSNRNDKEDNSFLDLKICYIHKEPGADPQFPQSMENYITEEEFTELVDEIREARLNSGKTGTFVVKNTTHTSAGKMYYYCRVEGDFDSYIFAITDTSFTRSFINSLLFRIFTAFVGIIFLAVAIIYAWSARITHRLKLIQNHLVDLPKNNYEKAYQDNCGDEIGDLSRSVEAMRLEIGTNEKTKQDMLQNLSHDFKTPIAVIKSYAEAYQDGMAGPEALDVIITQADLLKKKVNRLLQYNSLEYLTKDKPFEEVHMTELVNQVVTNNKFQTDVKFTLDLAEDVVFMGYRENWSTVVENIVDNAKRYAKSEIKIVLRESRLRIYNDGEPIDEQFLNSVFRPYEKGSKGQFGLGMSIVKKTVDFFGMNMHVQNEEYGGVSFIIEKPEN